LAFGAAATAGAAVAVVAAGGGSSPAPVPPASRAAAVAWDGLVGEPRAPVAVGQRMIVVLRFPSLADRVARNGGRASDRQHRRWTAAARSAQRLFISRLTLQGAGIRPEFTYSRVLNGFSAPLDPRTVALLERRTDVEGIYPVRAAYPATVADGVLARDVFGPGLGRRVENPLPGFDGSGVTVALLDTGVDSTQPYLRGRVLEGVDIVGESEGAVAAPKPDDANERERHGSQLAGLLVGAGGPSGLTGIATGASVIPIRVAGWQRDATGAWALYSRSDQLIAGLERAVDPNGDGDAHDAARVALVGVTERFAAFSAGPSARAASGALRLDTLVVTPAGNDGPAGPGFGNVSGPGGAPAALTVGAVDSRQGQERVRVVLRTGLKVLVDRTLQLAGAVAPDTPLDLPVAAPRLPTEEQLTSGSAALALERFFSEDGFSLVAGRAALVQAGPDTTGTVRAAARAGAAAVVVYGSRVPGGALGLDERVPVPVVAVSLPAARAALAAAERGDEVAISIGTPRVEANAELGRVAPFSSRGLAFDGRVKPELTAPGVGLVTSEPGTHDDGSPRFATITGSSAAAAIVAGSAALLADARPDLDARSLKGVLVGSAEPLPATPLTAQGAGLLDLGSAAAAELTAQPPTLAFGRATRREWRRLRPVRVTNLSTRTLRLSVRIERRGFPAAETFVTARPREILLRPGRSVRIRVVARVRLPARGGTPAEGALVLRPRVGPALRVPFAIAFGPRRVKLLGDASLSRRSFEPSDTAPAILSVQAGRVRAIGGADEVQPLTRLDVELWTVDAKRIGVIARVRNVLPGRYAFGITGRDPGGGRLKPRDYRLRLVAVSAGDNPVSERFLPFTIR